jgi:hypothetical protein
VVNTVLEIGNSYNCLKLVNEREKVFCPVEKISSAHAGY